MKLPAPPLRRVVALGECMIELQGQAFGQLQQTFGGDTLNTAVYLARCAPASQVQVAYATALGDDALSEGMLTRWQAEGLDTRLVRRLPGRMPGLYMISVAPDGERRFSYWRDRSAARDLFDTAPGDTPLERAAEQIDVFYLSGISLAILPPAGRERLMALMQRLKAHGAQLVFDNNYRPRLWPDAATAQHWFGRVQALADIALVTLDDEALLWDVPLDDGLLARTLALPCPELVVKRGAAPTLLREAGAPVLALPTEAVARVVDTTAAGDSFAGAYLACRLTGGTAADSVRAGNRLAARVVQHPGALIDRAAMAGLMAA